MLSLAPTPPANAFVVEMDLDVEEPKFPLDVYLCQECSHAQLVDILSPKALFRSYPYVSGTSPAFIAHFERYAADVGRLLSLQAGELVVEIGSNDGTLLSAFRNQGARVIGVDPAENIAEIAQKRGLETIPEFFTRDLAVQIKNTHGPASVVAANNVLAHIDDLGEVIEGVTSLLAPDGVLVFEVSYLLDLIEKGLFDLIYHEHLDYHAVSPLISFFERFGLDLFRVDRVPTHGGSIRGFAQLEGTSRKHRSIADLLELERDAGIGSSAAFHEFEERISGVRRDLRECLEGLRTEGRSIAAYGAPAKSTTLLHHFDIGTYIEFVIDDSPLKQGFYTPGYHIPVVGAEALQTRKPDYLVLLAWNFADEIIEKQGEFMTAGGKFIVPLPEVVVK